MAELNLLLSLVRTLANFKLHTSNTVCLRLKRSTIWTLWCQLNNSIEPVSGPLHVGTVKSPINTHSTNLTIARAIAFPANTNICITFVQRRPNVFDVGPTFYKSHKMFCVYWVSYIVGYIRYTSYRLQWNIVATVLLSEYICIRALWISFQNKLKSTKINKVVYCGCSVYQII